ncbi:MAG TPA: DNRLRE domain-containing protein, partial [Candidatus Dormibacteraeota bacterium]
MEVFSGAVNWQNSGGQWLPINTSATIKSGGYIGPASAPIDFRLGTSTSASDLLAAYLGSEHVGFGPPGTASGGITPTTSGNTVTYANISPGLDLQYRFYGYDVKEVFILRQRWQGSSDIQVTFPLHLTGLGASQAADGSISFSDGAGHSFSIPPGRMQDSAQDPQSGLSPSSPLQYSLDSNAQTLTISASGSWLKDPSRVYPVYIDPTLTANSPDDSYVSSVANSQNFNADYDSTLGAYVDNVGHWDSNTGDEWSFLHYNLGGLTSQDIINSATWKGYWVWNYYPSTVTTFWMHPAGGSWSASTITWNNKPGLIGSTITGTGARSAWSSVNVTSWVSNWVSGSWANNGIELDENGNGQTYWKRLSADNNNNGNNSYLSITYTVPSVTPPLGNLLSNSSYEAGIGAWNYDQGIAASTASDQTAKEGQSYAQLTPNASGLSTWQDVAQSVAANQSYSLSVWARSHDGTALTATLNGVAIGTNANEGTNSQYTLGAQWSHLLVPIDVQSSHTTIRAQLFLYTAGHAYDLDGWQLVNVGLADASMEYSDTTHWVANNLPTHVGYAFYADWTASPEDGPGFMEFNVSQDSGSVAQTTSIIPTPGQNWTCSAYVRSPDGTQVSGSLVIWALGGTLESGTQNFSVGRSWTFVSAPLTTHNTGHTNIRCEFYLHTLSRNLDVDGAQLVQTGYSNSSFEDWSCCWNWDSTINAVVYTNNGNSFEGSGYLETNTPTLGLGFHQDASISVSPGQSYTVGAWVRTPDGASRNGVLHLIGADGTLEDSSTSFIAAGSWTLVTASLNASYSHTTLRVQANMQSAGNFDWDGISLGSGNATGPPPPAAPRVVKSLINAPANGVYSSGQQITYQVLIVNPAYSSDPSSSLSDGLAANLLGTGAAIQINGQPCATGVTCQLNGNQISIRNLPLPASTANLVVPGDTVNANSGTATVTYTVIGTSAGLSSGATAACGNAINTASATDSFGTSLGSSATVSICDAGLGFEDWWTYAKRPAGPQTNLAVNVANGNLVLQQVDSIPVQLHGHLAIGLRRTYNSEDTALLSGLGVDGVTPFGGSIGKGWTFNVSEAGDLGDLGTGPDALYVPGAQTAANPLAVTLIDQDGTHHVFQPRSLSAMLSLPSLSGALAAVAPRVLTTPGVGFAAICIDTTYTAPAGVHLSVWRYVEVAGSCASPGNTAVLGFASERPDRLRSEFSWDGHLLDIEDGAGNEIRYTYSGNLAAGGSIGQLTSIAEWVSGTAGRSFTFSSVSSIPAPWNSSLTVRRMSVTDPAGRVTTYYSDQSASSFFTSHLLRVYNPDGSYVAYSYGGCGGSGDQLCSATDPRGNSISVTYTGLFSSSYDPFPNGGQPRVSSLTDRRGNQLTLDYNESPYSVTATEASDQVTYSEIDGSGRVGEFQDGPAGGGTIHTTYRTWDGDVAPDGSTGSNAVYCDNNGQTVDNDLCTFRRVGGGSDGVADEVTTSLYNQEGQLLKSDQTDSPDHLVTTYGYHAEYFEAPANSTRTFDDQPAGSGNLTITSGARIDASTLYYLSDRTASLSPLGNSQANQGSFASFETTYAPDNLAGSAPNSGSPTGFCSSAGAATGNSGSLCEVDAPSPDSRVTHATTRYTYDPNGQRISMTTPLVNAGQASGSYTYAYYGDSQRDLSGHTSAGGWLLGVTDPAGNFVAYAYDAYGHVVRTWDRNATQGTSLSSYPGTPVSPTAGHFTETLYGGGTDTTTAPFASPWRYALQTSDQLGDVTSYTLDLNGNPMQIVPPNGSSETITQSFDNDDELLTKALPVVSPGPSATTIYTFDAFGKTTSVKDANGNLTVYQYDAAERLVKTQWARNYPSSSNSNCHPAGTGDSSLFTAATIICQSSISYDNVDNVGSTTDGNNQVSSFRYDAAHRKTLAAGPRLVNGNPTTAQWVYDDDGNVLVACSPREYSEGAGSNCAAGGHFSQTSAYNAADKPVSVTTYREQDLVPASKTYQALTTSYAYDADGNPRSVTDPRGTTVSYSYSVLDRAVSQIQPRDSTTTLTTSFGYDAVGNRTSVTLPPAASAPSGYSTSRITAYAYDADNRLTDTVQGADSTTAANDTAFDPIGGRNIRTRVFYDADGHQVAELLPQAFSAGLSVATSAYLVVTTFDVDGRPAVQYSPRFESGSNGDLGLSPSQSAQCSTGNGPGTIQAPASQPIPTYPNNPRDVGVCVTSVNRDGAGNVTKLFMPTYTNSNPGRVMTYVYTGDNLVEQVIGPSPTGVGTVSTSYQYDGDGKAVQVATPTRTDVASYTPDELLASQTLANGTGFAHTTSYQYDANGNPTQVNLPTGQQQKTAYYSDNLPGLVTAAAQDSSGDAWTGNFKGTTAYYYDPDGNPVQVFSPSGFAASTGSSLKDANNQAGWPTVNTFTLDNLLATTTTPVASTAPPGPLCPSAVAACAAARQTSFSY